MSSARRRGVEDNDVLAAVFAPGSSRASRRNAITWAFQHAVPDDITDSVLLHLGDVEKDEELQWWSFQWIQLLSKCIDRLKDNDKDGLNSIKVLTHLTNIFLKHSYDLIPAPLTTHYFTANFNTLAYHIASLDASTVDPTIPTTITQLLQSWLPHLETIDIQSSLSRLVVQDFCLDEDLGDKIKSATFNRVLAEKRTQLDITTIDPYESLLDPTKTGGQKMFSLEIATRMLSDSSTSTRTRYTLLSQARGSLLPIIRTVSESGWIADELLRTISICYEDILAESAKGGVEKGDWEWILEVLEAVSEWMDEGVVQSVFFGAVFAVQNLQAVQKHVGKEGFRRMMSKWMERWGTLGDVFEMQILVLVSNDLDLLPKFAPKVLQNALKTGNMMPLGYLFANLQAAVASNPQPYVDMLDDIFAFMGTDACDGTAGQFFTPVLNGLADARPDAFIAHTDTILGLVPSCEDVMKIPMLMTLVKLLTAITETSPTITGNQETITKLGETVQRGTVNIISIITPLLLVIGGTSIECALSVTEQLLQFVTTNSTTSAQDVSTQTCLRTVMQIAASNPDIRTALAQSYVSSIEPIVAPDSRSSPAVKETARHVLDELRGLTLRAVQEQIGKVGAVWKQLGFDVEDPLLNAIEHLEVDKVQKYDVMLSYNWGTQSTVRRIHQSLLKRGYTVWFDLNLMSGNVYSKMAEAVLGSSVIVPCLTVAYEKSPNCKRELGFAADQARQGKKIVPVRLEEGPFTWSALITAGLLYTQIGEREMESERLWEGAMEGLVKEIERALGRVVEEREEEVPPSVVEEVKEEKGKPAPEVTTSQIPPAAVSSIFSRLDRLEGKFTLSGLFGGPTASSPDGTGPLPTVLEDRAQTATPTPQTPQPKRRPMSMGFFFNQAE
ncbi:hypothetical protein HK097_002081, partial [Rhizophlyctis rosea]